MNICINKCSRSHSHSNGLTCPCHMMMQTDSMYGARVCTHRHTHRLAAVPDVRWNKILSPRCTSSSILILAWLLMQSHKCHIASLRGATNRNMNMGKMRGKSFFRSLSLIFPLANRLVPNPPGIRGDKLFLIGYIGINKHMSVANLHCRRQFLLSNFISCLVSKSYFSLR